MRRKVLVLDDEDAICSSLRFALEDDFDVLVTQDAGQCMDILRESPVDVLLLDLRLGEEDGREVLKKARMAYPDLVVIVITAYGSIPSSVESIRAGAFSYITKPVDLDALRAAIAQGLDMADLHRRLRTPPRAGEDGRAWLGMVGKSCAMQEIAGLIDKVKNIDSSVLITGESGTGKELVGRAIHYSGKRRHGRFEAVNCAAIPRDLLESELFGYERGAFTGAVAPKPGRLQIANGGTVFLDEIAEMDVLLQSKLLRFIQDKEVLPLGGTSANRADVRIIAATNKDLPALVAARKFREDLYYRLNVINIDIPPLRERREDLPLLTAHFLAEKAALLGKTVKGISAAAYEVLLQYHFPGNIRELENIVERGVALSERTVIDACDLPAYLARNEFARGEGCLVRVRMGEPLWQVEKEVIAATLDRLEWNRREASRALGLSERGLRNKIARYALKKVEKGCGRAGDLDA
ncbi:MAG: sigma-54-dependent transcriptional regulator [Bacillota bacterium]